jgi:plastocyanin
MKGERIVPANLSVARGTEVRWNFLDPFQHNVTLAAGPRHVASANVSKGAHYSRTLDTPGTYKLFCYLHPITMTQVISVRP